MTSRLLNQKRPWYDEEQPLKNQREILEHNSQIPQKIKSIISSFPKIPIPRQEIRPLYEKIQSEKPEVKHLSTTTLSMSLALIDKRISNPTQPPISPLISALNLDPPLCPAPLNKLLKKTNVIAYEALIRPKTFVDCRARDIDLQTRIYCITKALNFIIEPLRYASTFSKSWLQNYPLTIPSHTFNLIRYAYHKPIQPIRIEAPGACSEIYNFNLNNGSKNASYIIKYFKQKTDSVNIKSFFYKEANLLMALNHPNILPCLAIDTHGLYFQKGTPFKDYPIQKLPLHLLAKCFLQIANAINYLHEQGFTHKDVKHDNIIMYNDTAYLIDYGLTQLTENDQENNGSFFFSPPEILANRPPFSNKVDVWSLGVLLLQTILGRVKSNILKDNSPASKQDFLKKHLNKPFPIDYFSKIESEKELYYLNKNDPEGHFQTLIVKCLHGDASQRPSMQDIINELESIYPPYSPQCLCF